ncbi:hypothetical protein [Cyclobacterium sp. SYSU L10401]|uniref:hypothetical protein n=1 Tax=Cyclobacterium sp. SYSU L10401 TaxID=2678657 RepID=UPI0013D17AC4|nr:hypothetical protein [Cyclobacterium sp. SYSU L10401]
MFALEIWDDEGSACTLYSLRQEGHSLNETDKFFSRFEDESVPYFANAQELLLLIIETIGNKYGATDDFINRFKNKGFALPPKPNRYIIEIKDLGTKFPLRLYCYKVSQEILILFNGGIKDHATDQECEDLSFKFQETQVFCQKISEALKEGLIQVNEARRRLEDYKGNTDILL